MLNFPGRSVLRQVMFKSIDRPKGFNRSVTAAGRRAVKLKKLQLQSISYIYITYIILSNYCSLIIIA